MSWKHEEEYKKVVHSDQFKDSYTLIIVIIVIIYGTNLDYATLGVVR